MKTRWIWLAACAMAFCGCEKKAEVIVTETRPPTTRDASPKLFATSDERFRNAKPSPVKATTPEGWRELPASQFRLLNYRFGPSGQGETWVTIASGSVLDNVNRWLRQFGAEPIDEAGLKQSRQLLVAGTPGTWVEAEGEYSSGMGSPNKPNFALAGVIALVDGKIITVKMVGPKDEVKEARPALESFIGSLTLAE
jgi:hypothetical protein